MMWLCSLKKKGEKQNCLISHIDRTTATPEVYNQKQNALFIFECVEHKMFKVTWARLCVWDAHASFGRTHDRVDVRACAQSGCARGAHGHLAVHTSKMCTRPCVRLKCACGRLDVCTCACFGRVCGVHGRVDVFWEACGSAVRDAWFGRARGSAVRDARFRRAHGAAVRDVGLRQVRGSAVLGARLGQDACVHGQIGCARAKHYGWSSHVAELYERSHASKSHATESGHAK